MNLSGAAIFCHDLPEPSTAHSIEGFREVNESCVKVLVLLPALFPVADEQQISYQLCPDQRENHIGSLVEGHFQGGLVAYLVVLGPGSCQQSRGKDMPRWLSQHRLFPFLL